MTTALRALQVWSPRILGICVALFLGIFALDAVGEGLSALFLHALPALLLLLIVVASWRREWIGAVVFIVAALFYGVTTWRRLDWVLVISGPLLVVGTLFLWSWRGRTARNG